MAHQQDHDLFTQALPLLLHHSSSISQDQQLVCTLLCVSKSVRAAVAQHCTGRVPLRFKAHTLPQAQQVAAWLVKHADLLQFMALELPYEGEAYWGASSTEDRHEHVQAWISSRQLAADAVANALQQAAAAAAPHKLQLQSFQMRTPSAAILRQLANSCSSNLTELQCKQLVCGPEEVQEFAAALASLTALRSLTLPLSHQDPADNWRMPEDYDAGYHPTLLASLSGLTQLSKLQLDSAPEEFQWELLPQQLQHLKLLNWYGGSVAAGHLTALTTLEIVDDDEFEVPCAVDAAAAAAAGSSSVSFDGELQYMVLAAHEVSDNDVLPPNLTHLVVQEVLALEPLLPLRQLRALQLGQSYWPAQQLLQLSSLTGLRSLRLRYGQGDAAVDAAAAWAKLPVDSLSVEHGEAFEWEADLDFDSYMRSNACYAFKLPTPTVQCMAKVSSMTQLSIQDCKASAVVVAAALRQLTLLQRLLFRRVFWCKERNRQNGADSGSSNDSGNDSDGGSDEEADINCTVQGWECVLQALVSLPGLSSLRLSHEPLGASATQLAAATHLSQLALDHCSVDDAAVAAVISSVTGLRGLDLHYNPGITNAVLPVIVQHLQQLTALDVRDTNITREGRQQLASMARLTEVRAGRQKLDSPDAPEPPKIGGVFLFSEEHLPRIQQEHPLWSVEQINEKLTILWNELTHEEQSQYIKAGEEDLKRYGEEMEAYMSKW